MCAQYYVQFWFQLYKWVFFSAGRFTWTLHGHVCTILRSVLVSVVQVFVFSVQVGLLKHCMVMCAQYLITNNFCKRYLGKVKSHCPGFWKRPVIFSMDSSGLCKSYDLGWWLMWVTLTLCFARKDTGNFSRKAIWSSLEWFGFSPMTVREVTD